MEIKEILKTIREKNELTQDQLAEKVLVTRQASQSRAGRSLQR